MTQKLKRYDVHENHPESIAAMAEFPDGDYVKFEDYEKLKAQLEKAEAVIGFYASEDTWIKKELDEKGNLYQWWDKKPNDVSIFPYSIGASNGNFHCLGRRAREYFKEKESNG